MTSSARAVARHMLPDVVSGYPLEGVRVSVYRPQSGVNLATNPSAERAATNYSSTAGAVTRSAERSRWGAYSIKVVPTAAPTDNLIYGATTPIELTAGTVYYASYFGYFAPGKPYRLYFATTADVPVGGATLFRGRGRWERVVVAYRETATANRRVILAKDGDANTIPYYVDGLQVEADRLTSYIDGDRQGLIKNQTAYYWVGTPHASESVRVASTRSGGVEVKLSDYGFRLLALVGLGLTGFASIATPNAYVGGSQYERTVQTERTFDLVGAFESSDGLAGLQRLRSQLGDVLRPNAGILDQPMVLRFQSTDPAGTALGEPVEIVATLEPGGMAGNLISETQERVTLTFKTYLPYVGSAEGEAGAALSYQNAFTADNDILSRETNGAWTQIMGNNPLGAGYTEAFLALPDGRLLVGGNFTNAGGVADADYLFVYDFETDTISALNATPLNNFILDMALLPDGNTAILVGNFTNAGGDANADYACYLDLTTGAFSAINATPLGGAVYHAEVLNDGNALLGGVFTNAGGVADADYLCHLNTTTGAYSALNATPLNSTVTGKILRLKNGDVVFGGNFTNAGGDANADYAAYLTVATGAYSALSTNPLGEQVWTFAQAADGTLYIGTIANLYSWSGPGAPITVVDGGMSGGTIHRIIPMPDNTLVLKGGFTQAGNLTVYRYALWNKSSFVPADAVVTSQSIKDMILMPDGKFVIARYNDAAGYYAASTTLTNAGSADTYPTFEFVGPGAVFQIKNWTTGDVLYFNLTLNAGERALLTLGPGRISFVSTFRGNILNTILPGSFLSTFRLAPGANSVSVLIAGTTDADTALVARWKTCYLSADDALYR